MNVLSLFDGISCGQLALTRAGIKYDNYYAAEVDKNAISIAKKNFPKTIHLGDVREINVSELPKIDIIFSGSPCQGFSIAGKQLAFDDPRSKLFFEFVRILKEVREINPDVKFLMENVPMKHDFLEIITDYLKVEPVLINSSEISAQSRKRYYWMNWKVGSIFNQKDLVFEDIVEDNIAEDYFYKNRTLNYIKKETPHRLQKPHQLGHINKSNSQANRVYSIKGKSVTMKAEGGGLGAKMGLYLDHGRIRRATPIEAERLQTLPDNYSQDLSDNQRYKVIGNGWTVDVICHLLSYL